MSQSVLENLNSGLHKIMANNPDILVLGEDISDPYGGAFKVTKNLSEQFPKRVISTPISELALTGIANGLALSGKKPIIEYMFGDFAFLGFDQIVNFAAKIPSMFGESVEFPIVIRIPVGGGRGYGPTHSQSLQKFFVGVPNLHLFELSPFIDCSETFQKMFELNTPCIFFENKLLYSNDFYGNSFSDNLYKLNINNEELALLELHDSETKSGVLVTTGGCFERSLEAAKKIFLETELEIDILVCNKLYPLDFNWLSQYLSNYPYIFTVEEGTPGGSWGGEFAVNLPDKHVSVLTSENSIIPSSKHLEDEMLISSQSILSDILEIIDND